MSAWDFEDNDKQPDAESSTDSSSDVQEPTAPAPQDAAQSTEEPPAETAAKAEAGNAFEQEEELSSMDDVDFDAASGPAEIKPGEIVTGTVVSITEEGVLVDIGGKAEGIVPIYEFLDRSEMPERGDQIEVAVVKQQDEQDGMTVLSKKSADYERVWNRVIKAMETGEILDAMVTDRVKGGLRVDLGVAGFVPASHVATRDVRNLDRFVGRPRTQESRPLASPRRGGAQGAAPGDDGEAPRRPRL